MRLSVASNGCSDLVQGLRGLPVEELYGKLPSDVVGGGRPSMVLGAKNRRAFARHVREVTLAGLRYNYLLNASCLDNREMTRGGQRQVRRLLDWVSEIGCGAVTVALPQLLTMVKSSYPHLKTRVSVFACVDRVHKARMWEDLGADTICLDSLLVNREFAQLRALKEAVRCDLQLLVNNSCIQGCAFSPAHMNGLCHASQQGHVSGGFFVDWCLLKCSAMKAANPIHYIRNEWIRPEDLHLYEEMGFNNFKIVERDMPTELMLRRVRAYVERRWEGNLLELVQPYGHAGVRKTHPWLEAARRLKWLVSPRRMPLASLAKIGALARTRGLIPDGSEAAVHVDNRELDGFMERFKTQGCRDVDCRSCGHCARYAARAVKMEPAFRAACRKGYNEIFSAIDSGAFFRGT